MTPSVEESFAYCCRVTRRRARNFYYSFVLLGREEHDAMCAVYAFMRYCDDLSDDPLREGAEAQALLDRWRTDLDAALGGRFTDHLLWPAFCSVVERYGIPARYFHEMIDGVASDLEPREFQTFEELYRYCYQVASVAGLSVVHILGFESPERLAARREMRRRVPTYEHPARRARGLRAGPRLLSRGGHGPFPGEPGGSAARESVR